MSAIAWHPMRLATASEDDSSPIIGLGWVWDLRNARAPEKVVSLHLFEELFSDRITVDPNWPRKMFSISPHLKFMITAADCISSRFGTLSTSTGKTAGIWRFICSLYILCIYSGVVIGY